MTNIIDIINQNITDVNRIAINFLPKSGAIATYIDLPVYTLLTLNPLKIITGVTVATATYQTRANINYYLSSDEFNEYIKDKTYGFVDIKYTIDSLSEMTGIESKFVIGAIAGTIGGAFRYYVTGQNPVIGALNNIAYETCNNIELCSNNKAVNIAFTITVETLDATAQTALTLLGTNNVLGALHSSVKTGMLIGYMIGVNGNFLYAPALKLKTQENTFYDYAEKAYNSTFTGSYAMLGESLDIEL